MTQLEAIEGQAARTLNERELRGVKAWEGRLDKDKFREVTRAEFWASIMALTVNVHPRSVGPSPYTSHFDTWQGRTYGRIYASGSYDPRLPDRFELPL